MLAKNRGAAIIGRAARARGGCWQGARAAELADDLIAWAEQEPDWRAPYVHEPREGRDQEKRQPENDVQLVDKRRLGDQLGRADPEGGEPLRPAHEADHFFAA